jgi:prevent-host-death family protein
MSKTVPAADLAANLDALLDDLAEKNEEIVITRDGRAVARVVPIRDEMRGPLYGSVLYEGDIVSPLDVEWEAAK